MPVALLVNVDHVATLRQARGATNPDPVWAASLCEMAGAAGITVHLREDRRHIQDRDLEILRKTVRGVLNLEMAATPEMIDKALAIRPDIVTLVPERREERTTEGGLDLLGRARPAVQEAVAAFHEARIPVSLFIGPESAQVKAAAALRVPRIEINTGRYCEVALQSSLSDQIPAEMERIARAADEANRLGLHVAAGHGLDYPNAGPIVRVPSIEEVSIGHAIIARSVSVGLVQAVRDMLTLIRDNQ